jgi:hypothetical protein
MTDNLDRVRAEAEQRKQRARQLGLPELTTRFYRDLARFYPAWRDNNPAMVPQMITDIREVSKDTVEFQDRDHRYSLAWKEWSGSYPDGDVFFSGALSLLVDENRVLEIHLDGDEYSQWLPKDVHAFIEGPWVSSFKAVVAEGERLRQQSEEERRQREAEELRSRFGIPDKPAYVRSVEPVHGLAYRFGLLAGQLLTAIRK